MDERLKGEWHTTIPKQVAEYFLQHEDQPVSLAELFLVIYPDEVVSDPGIGKLYQHFTRARKILRRQGKFLADPRKHAGKYVLEKEPTRIIKQTETGKIRAKNGFEIMQGGKTFMLDAHARQQALQVIEMLQSFIIDTSREYIKSMFPALEVDKEADSNNNAAPKTLNPPTQ